MDLSDNDTWSYQDDAKYRPNCPYGIFQLAGWVQILKNFKTREGMFDIQEANDISASERSQFSFSRFLASKVSKVIFPPSSLEKKKKQVKAAHKPGKQQVAHAHWAWTSGHGVQRRSVPSSLFSTSFPAFQESHSPLRRDCHSQHLSAKKEADTIGICTLARWRSSGFHLEPVLGF